MAAEENSSEVVKEMVEATAASNVKVVSEGPAFFTNQLYNQANNSTAGWSAMGQAIVGKITESIIATSPSEGANAQLMTALLVKNQQTTAPLTAGQLVPGQS